MKRASDLEGAELSTEQLVTRTWKGLVVLMASIAVLAAAAFIVRTSPPASGAPGSTAAVHPVDRVKLATGEKATLFMNDSFKVVALCVDAGGGAVTAEYGVKALKDNTLVFSTDEGNTTDTRLDKADGLFHWSTDYEPSGMTALYYGYDYYQEFTGESPNGNLLMGRVSAGVNMRGADCIYDGLFIS